MKKIKKFLRTNLTLLLSATMLSGIVAPVGARAEEADEAAGPVLVYDFNSETGVQNQGTIVNSGSEGDRLNGTVVNEGATLADDGNGGMALSMPGGDAATTPYVTIPGGVIKDGQKDLTVSFRVNWNGERSYTWVFGLGVSDSRYLFAGPGDSANDSVTHGSYTEIRNGGKNNKVRVTSGIKQESNQWREITVVLKGGESLSYYMDGKLINSLNTTFQASDVMGTEEVSGFLGKSFYSDPNFGGLIDNFKVWDRALASEEICGEPQEPEKPEEPDQNTDLAVVSDTYVIPSVLKNGDALPGAPEGVSVAYENIQGFQISDGIVYSGADTAVTGSVDAVLSAGEQSIRKSFKITVLPESAEQLLGYYRTATDANEGNDGSSANSLHLALKGNGDTGWNILNKNYGILFVNFYSTRKDASKGLINPQIFVMKDGSYGIIGTRTTFAYNQATATPDDTGASSIFFATTADFKTYNQAKNDNVINVGETNGVNDPYAVYDSANEVYVVGWTDNSGTEKYTTFADLNDTAAGHGEVREGSVTRLGQDPAEDAIPNYVKGYYIPVPSEIANGLKMAFGRVYNTGYEPFENVTVKQNTDSSEIELPGSVTLDYSDGSVGTLPVEWDLSDVDTSVPGEYTVSGQVKQADYNPKAEGQDYTVPYAEDRADPDLFKFEWTHKVDGELVTETKYLFIATNDTDGECRIPGNPVYPYLGIRMGDTIEEMADVAGDADKTINETGINKQEHVLLEAGDKIQMGDSGEELEMTGSFWAPELHRIGGKLSILFGPGIGTNGTEQRSSIMQLKKDEEGYDLDPTVRENWEEPQIITYADGTTWTGAACDMTYFADKNGQSYYVWSGFSIAKFDENTPWKLSASSNKDRENYGVLLEKNYAWEAGGAYEGQYVVEHNGKYYITYSARRVDGRYTLGYLSADVNADLLNPDSWTKTQTPVLFSSQIENEWQSGPGHAAFAEGPDGELLFVYHTYSHVTRADGFRGGKYGNGTGDAVKKTNGRDAYIRRVHWGANDRMILDMTLGEELAENSRQVRVTVNVEADTVVDPEVTKEALLAQIKEAQELKKEDYTEESWTAFEQVLQDAIVIAEKEDASQEEVDQKTEELKMAMDNLKKAEPKDNEKPEDNNKNPEKPDDKNSGTDAGDKNDNGSGNKNNNTVNNNINNNNSSNQKNGNQKSNTVATGDQAPVLPMAATAVGTLVVIFILLRRKHFGKR